MADIIQTKASRSRGRKPDGTPNPVDLHVGQRIRLRRQLLNLSQMVLAGKLGLTFQQMQKYEHGQNRVSASRLWDMSQVLGVDVNYFFQDMPLDIARQSPRMSVQHAEHDNINLLETAPELTNEGQELLHCYYQLAGRPEATHILSLLKSLSNHSLTHSGEH